jgi:hypothetical protein
MHRWPSFFARLGAAVLALGLICCPPVFAQEEEGGGGGESKGRPLDGYIATGALCGLALYIVAKTARR